MRVSSSRKHAALVHFQRKAEMKSCNEEEKEPLMRVVKEIRCDRERIPSNLRYIDRKNVRAATVKINKNISFIKT